MKRIRRVRLGPGAPCPKCHRQMDRFEHGPDWQPRPHHYYFRYWDTCSPCGHVQLYHGARVNFAISAELDQHGSMPDVGYPALEGGAGFTRPAWSLVTEAVKEDPNQSFDKAQPKL
jgi:hypothetical protein